MEENEHDAECWSSWLLVVWYSGFTLMLVAFEYANLRAKVAFAEKREKKKHLQIENI